MLLRLLALPNVLLTTVASSYRRQAGSVKGTAPAKDHPPKLAVSPSMDHLLSLSTPATRVQSSSSVGSIVGVADGAGGGAAQLLARVPSALPR